MNVDFTNDKYLISLDRAEYSDLVGMLDDWRFYAVEHDTFGLARMYNCSCMDTYLQKMKDFSPLMYDILSRADNLARQIICNSLH